jgi:protein gp37
MGQKTSIQWTDCTWSPLRARVKADAAEIAREKGYASLAQIAEKMAGHVGPHCEHVSPGCENCYSGTNNHRCLPANGTGLPFDRRSRDLVDGFIDEKILTQPLGWRTPRKVFVENQSDLFGEWVTDEQIDRVFAVMALTPHITYQVLTKRAGRMLDHMLRLARSIDPLERAARSLGYTFKFEGLEGGKFSILPWPLPIWLGVSVENQATADERIPLLLQTPAAVRFVSYEPALGPVDFQRAAEPFFRDKTVIQEFKPLLGLDWVIVGGESGPGARPFDIEWARNTIAQCKTAGVACFVKQLGGGPEGSLRPKLYPNRPIPLLDRKGGDWEEWPKDLRVRDFPEAVSE